MLRVFGSQGASGVFVRAPEAWGLRVSELPFRAFL